jgi:hypothetical protein
VLAVQNLFSRNRGKSLSAIAIGRLTPEAAIELLERRACAQVKARADYRQLLGVTGIGQVLGLTILLETGLVGRFARVGNYASYSRCVGSERLSNDKRKGRGNTRSGNKYLAWAYLEAANFAVRYNPTIKRYYAAAASPPQATEQRMRPRRPCQRATLGLDGTRAVPSQHSVNPRSGAHLDLGGTPTIFWGSSEPGAGSLLPCGAAPSP